MNIFRKLFNILFFKFDEDDEPITAGIIVWGVLSRVFILTIAASIFVPLYNLFNYWYLLLFVFWLLAFYPGFQEYQKFQEQSKQIIDSTMCGSCVNFSADNQLCKIYDQHITTDIIPCEGLDWEPKSYEDLH